MRNGKPVLIDYEYNRETGIEQFTLTLRRDLLHRPEDILK